MTAIQDDQVAGAKALIINAETNEFSEHNNWQAIGSGWINYPEQMQERFNQWQLNIATELVYPQAVDLLTLAKWHYAAGNLLDAAEALPKYIRNQVVKQPK